MTCNPIGDAVMAAFDFPVKHTDHAARAQSAAAAGTILVAQQACDRTPSLAWNDAGRDYDLKGFEAPVRPYLASDGLPSLQG